MYLCICARSIKFKALKVAEKGRGRFAINFVVEGSLRVLTYSFKAGPAASENIYPYPR